VPNNDPVPENVIGMSLEELQQKLLQMGEPGYRARQIMHWLYKKRALSFGEMTDLPQALRRRLEEEMAVRLPEIRKVALSQDGTRKYLLALDGDPEQSSEHTIEAVAIPEGKRLTVCLSSQVGCAIGCPFCATGQEGFLRHLLTAEIVGQMLVIQQEFAEPITNVVMMGMGEPLANYRNVMKALRLMNHADGMALGARRLTISTAGLAPGIRQLAGEDLQLNLAVSLHAPNDELRNRLVPVNRRYPLKQLLAACREYIEKTRRRITFQYILLRGVNDSVKYAHQLGQLLSDLLCHVNLIPVNPTGQNGGYLRPAEEDTGTFARILLQYGVKTTIRRERGTDIRAACGQLKQGSKESSGPSYCRISTFQASEGMDD